MMTDKRSKTLEQALADSNLFARHVISRVLGTGSTNDDLKREWTRSHVEQQIRIAEFQSAGRGQRGRAWQAIPGQSLLFSFSLQGLRQEFPMSLIAGLALKNALKSLVKADDPVLWLKWPNDVWLGRGKLAGILCENSQLGDISDCVVGVGLNLKPLGNSEIASASFSEVASSCDPEVILCAFFAVFEELVAKGAASLVEEWTNAAALFWQTEFVVSCNDAFEFKGVPLSLEQDGSLVLTNGQEKSRRLLSATLKPVF